MRAVLILISLWIGCCAKAQHPISLNTYSFSGQAQGTTYQIKYYASSEIVKQQAIDSILKVIDASMSIYKPNSLISAFNNPDTDRIIMDKHMKNVLIKSFKVNKLSKSYFDITAMPLVKLWGFGPKGVKNEPNIKEIDSVKNLVGMNNLKLKGNVLQKTKSNISIDVNGIAQGYSVDVLSDFLKKSGCKSFIVELGGEIYAEGKKPNGNSFIVEIQRPYLDQSKQTHKVKLDGMAITTSANYEKELWIGNKKISHHMNPFTGYPVENNTLSATVISKNAIDADALDNYLMYLKPQEAILFVEKIKNTEAYLIFVENNEIKELQTSKFNNYIYN